MRLTSAVLLAAALIGLAAPAQAEEKPAKAADTTSRYLNISPVAAPIVVDGRLINYIFLTIRIELKNGVDVPRLREREPYFRDALVRAAHRHPFVKAGDYIHVDEEAVKRSVRADVTRMAGPNTVQDVKIMNAQAQKVRGVVAPPAPAEMRAPVP